MPDVPGTPRSRVGPSAQPRVKGTDGTASSGGTAGRARSNGHAPVGPPRPASGHFRSPSGDPGVQELSHVLRLSRLRQGLSLRTVARGIGLTAHSGIAEYESGRRIPPADLLCSYEQMLGLPPGYLERLRQQALQERAERQILQQTVRSHVAGPSQLPGRKETSRRVCAAAVAAITAARAAQIETWLSRLGGLVSNAASAAARQMARCLARPDASQARVSAATANRGGTGRGRK